MVGQCIVPTTKLSELFSQEFFEENPDERDFQKDYMNYIKDFSFQDGKIHLFFYENEPIESLIFSLHTDMDNKNSPIWGIFIL